MKLFGLTGGVGMGKSTAAGFLLQLGVRVVDTDDIAHQLVRLGQPALAEIQNEFGPTVISATGELNRAAMARIVFTDELARKKLEAILHPRIRSAWVEQVQHWREINIAAAAVIIPLLYETQAESAFDKIICVACSTSSQQERLAARGWNADQIRQRIAAQMPVEQKIARAHHLVWTEGTVEVHQAQLQRILSRI